MKRSPEINWDFWSRQLQLNYLDPKPPLQSTPFLLNLDFLCIGLFDRDETRKRKKRTPLRHRVHIFISSFPSLLQRDACGRGSKIPCRALSLRFSWMKLDRRSFENQRVVIVQNFIFFIYLSRFWTFGLK